VPDIPQALPLSDPPTVERADAARNRKRILTAAARLFAEGGSRPPTMDELAKAAKVGRATLYRRYPTVAAVAEALLDEHEHELQEKILSGPPPLGPGAGPEQRLAAFYEAMVGLLEQHASLVLGTEVGQLRFGTGAYAFWRTHVRHLLEQAGTPDPPVLADIALAPLDPQLFLHQREAGVSSERIAAGLGWVAGAVSRGSSARPDQ
jgi:AcrR family transcriptional regulator